MDMVELLSGSALSPLVLVSPCSGLPFLGRILVLWGVWNLLSLKAISLEWSNTEQGWNLHKALFISCHRTDPCQLQEVLPKCWCQCWDCTKQAFCPVLSSKILLTLLRYERLWQMVRFLCLFFLREHTGKKWIFISRFTASLTWALTDKSILSLMPVCQA